MRTRHVVYWHLGTVLLLIADFLLFTTSYKFTAWVLAALCISYYISMFACAAHHRPITRFIVAKVGSGVSYVLSLSALFIAGVCSILFSLLMCIWLLVTTNTPAHGQGYSLKAEGGFLGIPRYNLYRNYFVFEKYIGGLPEFDYAPAFRGKISKINRTPGDSTFVTVERQQGDTVLVFLKSTKAR